MSQAYVVDGVRTPIGRYGGALSSTVLTTWPPASLLASSHAPWN